MCYVFRYYQTEVNFSWAVITCYKIDEDKSKVGSNYYDTTHKEFKVCQNEEESTCRGVNSVENMQIHKDTL